MQLYYDELLVQESHKYSTEEDTYLSTDAKKVFEKVEPNEEKGKAIYEIFNRVWHDVMSRGL
jgi:hypothetical protein